MRINTVLFLILAGLTAVLAVSYSRTAERVTHLEERLAELDDAMMNVTVPMDTMRQDISGIYAELDRLQEAEASPSPAAAPTEVTEKPAFVLSQAPERAEQRAPAALLPAYQYGSNPSAYSGSGVAGAGGGNTPKHRSFHGPTDEDE